MALHDHGAMPGLFWATVIAQNPDGYSVNVRYDRAGSGGAERVLVGTGFSGPEDEGEVWLPPEGARVLCAIPDGGTIPVVLQSFPLHACEPVTREPGVKMWKHRSGTFEKIFADGKRWMKVIKQALSEFADNYVIKVGKNWQVLVSQSAEVRVGENLQVYAGGVVSVDAAKGVIVRFHNGGTIQAQDFGVQTVGNFAVEASGNASVKSLGNVELSAGAGTAGLKGVGGIFDSGVVTACTFCPILGAHFGAAGNTARASNLAPAIPIP